MRFVRVAVVALFATLTAAHADTFCRGGAGLPDGIFLDSFEDGGDRCWTGPLTCLDDLGQQAPACADSEPLQWWMDRCEESWPCYKECPSEGTPDACLLLQIDYLLTEPARDTNGR